MGNVRRWLPFCTLLVIVVVGLSFLVYAVIAAPPGKVERPYEKYFEHQGGGVYHLEIEQSAFFEGEEELDTTKTTAKIIARWREAHKNEFRIVGITFALHVRYPPYIIITEPK